MSSKFVEDLKLKTGTTTVGIVAKDAIVLAADRRASAGFYVAHKFVRKVVYITDTIAMTTAGSVADLQFLYNLAKEIYHYNKITNRPITVKALANYLGLLLSVNKYFPYEVQLIIGGYDSNGPSLYYLDLYGSVTEEKRYIATGSGSPNAIGVLADEYREDMTGDEAVEVAKRAIFSAIKWDSFTGTSVIVSKITPEGHVEYEFVPQRKSY
ncbi:MAG: proteasome subunit beta [Sulfolobales archaeon]|jgi:proteasome beta subunit|nr:proteasome subunit beta [Sulfolobales archaeon]MDT7905407.1 proteasome subunit beta [Sulfolobales archaeon]